MSGKPDVKSPQDMDKLKLSLQGYSGMGTSHGQSETWGYSEANALQFFPGTGSPWMAKVWRSGVCTHVLRYYSAGIVWTFGKGQLVTITEKPVGERRRPSSGHGMDLTVRKNGVPVLSAGVDQAGLIQKEVVPGFFCLYGRCGFVSGKEKMARWRKCSDARKRLILVLRIPG